MVPVKVFISYAHDDLSFMRGLRDQLAGLERSGRIEVFDDGDIPAGATWDCMIRDRLEQADIIILMLSPSFISSRYIGHVEYKQALERWRRDEVVVYPIVVRPIALNTLEVRKIQARPHDDARRLKPLVA